MGKFIVSAGIGLAAGLICFFVSVAFLALLLLTIRGASGIHPDMTLAYRVAIPVALLAAFSGFTVALVRSWRAPKSAD
jgi:Na+-transporting NADH:ubiquinone oxidoreductase subunit NqrD